MNFSSAALFCCTKFMDLAGVETEQEKNCLYKEMKNRGQDTIQMWTSGDTEPCEESFAWCPSHEMVDFTTLKWKATLVNGTKRKIAMSLGSSLEFQLEHGKAFKKALCESADLETCTNSRCLQYKCSAEIEILKMALKKNATSLNKEWITFAGCGMTLVSTSVANIRSSFHGAYKGCCVTAGRLLTIATQDKLDCLQRYFKENLIPSNRYWIGGASMSCPKINQWCDGKDNPLIGDHVKWAKGEPSNDLKKECVYADYDSIKSTFTLGKISCKTLMLYICENEFVHKVDL